MSAAPNRQQDVCVLSSHPIVIRELTRLLSSSSFGIISKLLESVSPVAELAVPTAAVYVVDCDSIRSSTAVVSRIAQRHLESRIIVVAESVSESAAFNLLKLGVKGLLTHEQLEKELSSAVAAIALGGYWVPRVLLSKFVDSLLKTKRAKPSLESATGLTRRQKDVMNGLLANLSNKEIADSLNISERTVKFHVSALLEKFGVRRRADLIVVCYQDAQANEPRLPEWTRTMGKIN